MKSIPLYKQIQEDIKKMIRDGALREGDRVPSEKELAEQYRVSQITSKNALIGLVEEGYVVRVQGKGTFIKGEPLKIHQPGEQQETGVKLGGTIGLIIPTMKTIVDQRLFDNIEKYVTEAGYDLMVRITRESQEEEAKAVENFAVKGVKGLIIFPVENENYNNSILRLTLDGSPLVLIDRFLKEITTYSVSSDNIQGTYEAVDYLLGKGHRSIGYISPEITNTVTEERAAGFEKAFLHNKCSIDKDLWCMLPLETISSGQAQEQIIQYLQERPQISAVMTVNTELCHYVYLAAKQLGRKIPEQLELITCDPPGLEHIPFVQQNEREMAKITVQLLIEQINGIYEPQRVVVPVNFIT